MATQEEKVRQICPEDLVRRIGAGERLQVMDVRAPERVAASHLDLVPEDWYHNIRGSVLAGYSDLKSTGLDPEHPVVTVCGHGKDSKILAGHLNRLGADAMSLAGGLAAWMSFLVPRELDPPQGLDRLVQFDRIGKGCLSYLLVSRGKAVLVDPPLQFAPLLQAVEESGADLVAVADTHAHADYVSGGVLLGQRFDVPYYLHPADSFYPYDGTPGQIRFRALAEGDTVPFGESALEVVHTPGHTEGSVTFLVEGRVALTGDFLFVESIGRPDLGETAEAWAPKLWASVERVRAEWDPGTAIYPTHYGSSSERRMGQAVGISLGELLAENPILQIPDKASFIEFILGNHAPFPEAYRKIKALNVGLAPIVQKDVDALEVGRNECALGGTTT